MYICENCGKILEATIPIREYHDELDERPYEQYYGCPYCKSDQVVEAKQCDLCGKYISSDYIVLSDGTVACDNCYVLH